MNRLAPLVLQIVLLVASASIANPLFATPSPVADKGQRFFDATYSEAAELRVLYVDSTGWAYRDEAGELTGVTVEIMRRFAEWSHDEHQRALALEFVEERDWSTFYQRVRDASGGVFGLGNVTITETRRQELAFSPPYVTNVAVLISHHDVEPVDDRANLALGFANLSALAFAGTLHETRLRELAERHWQGMPLEFSGSNDDIIARAADGTHFAYIDAYNYYRARQNGAPLHHHPAFDDPGEEFGIIMPLDNDWQPLLAEFFHADGGLLSRTWYRELLSYHLGAEVAEILLGQTVAH